MNLRQLLLSGVAAAALLFSFPGISPAAVHTVNQGETLYSISRQYGSSVENIMSSNNLSDDFIYPGESLYIPDQSQSHTAYYVLPGDTLYQIGQKFGLGYSQIMSYNGLSSEYIYAGQTLYIPGLQQTGSPQVSRSGFYEGNVPYTRSDFELLSRLITAEADSESYLTKVAVGAVVLNRILSGCFPVTIPDVIYQVDEGGAYQFEPVLNGWINVNPSPMSMLAAQDALDGNDPTQGALYFFESWIPNGFLQSRPVSVQLDSFTFTY
ncbi:MAG TPA: cell wall hydrolase [Desulfotomaculum sp.]|nr:MAG: Cell wall hydrolase SleB [Desulfotomaculum sp. 46_80]KUK85412.1 MAG: Cell wall hydrolase SleB [Desulfofundulus kuznetsovii]HAG09991.1 cell wall hydrolase [Desulfotomaculum sp.]HBY03367.1 cell wall hydrolase [Desulfotomaculum sp.]